MNFLPPCLTSMYETIKLFDFPLPLCVLSCFCTFRPWFRFLFTSRVRDVRHHPPHGQKYLGISPSTTLSFYPSVVAATFITIIINIINYDYFCCFCHVITCEECFLGPLRKNEALGGCCALPAGLKAK